MLLDAKQREGAASRLYYAAFHAGRAALLLEGRHAKTHLGQLSLFQDAFGPAEIYGAIMRERIKADYAHDPYETPLEGLRGMAGRVEEFVRRCRTIIDERAARGPDEPDPQPDL